MNMLNPWQVRSRARPGLTPTTWLALRGHVRLLLESLEDRLVPSTVATAGDVNLLSQTATIANPGFDNGLAGWTVSKGDTGLVSVVTQWLAHGGSDPKTQI